MKNKFWLIGIIVLVVVIGLVIAFCRNGDNGTTTDEEKTDPSADFDTETQDIDERVIPEGMVWVGAGSFTMGPDINNNNATVEVTFTKGFYIGKYLVTQDLYETVMKTNPSNFNGGADSEPKRGEVQGKRPVEMVNWYHVIAFCNRLSILEGLTPVYNIDGKSNTDADVWLHTAVPTSNNAAWNAVTADWTADGYRLPTSAQWEFAAKGGNAGKGYRYSGSNSINEVAWYSVNSDYGTHETGKKAPNELGIYDMSGNLWEWCWDRWGNYPGEPVTDYTGPVSGNNRVIRGGSWFNSADLTQSISRDVDNPDSAVIFTGFRLVRP